jgi:DNA-binding transcriptional LysR family regulator
MFDIDGKAAVRRTIGGALVGVMAIGGVAATTPASAAGVPQVRMEAQGALIEVREKWVRNDRRNWDRRHWDRRWDRRDWDRRWHRHRHRDGGWVGAGIAGLAAGALLGGIIAGPRTYVGPGYYNYGYYAPPRVVYAPRGYEPWSAAWYSYCEARYRSFDPRSGTFMGYDGRRHFCR